MGLELEFTEGMQFDKGYISLYFITDQERMEAVLDDAIFLLYASKISDGGFPPAAGKGRADEEAVPGYCRGRRG